MLNRECARFAAWNRLLPPRSFEKYIGKPAFCFTRSFPAASAARASRPDTALVTCLRIKLSERMPAGGETRNGTHVSNRLSRFHRLKRLAGLRQIGTASLITLKMLDLRLTLKNYRVLARSYRYCRKLKNTPFCTSAMLLPSRLRSACCGVRSSRDLAVRLSVSEINCQTDEEPHQKAYPVRHREREHQ